MVSEETLNFQTFLFEVLFIVLFIVAGSWTLELLRVSAKAQAKRDNEADGFPFPVPQFRFFPWRSANIGYQKTETEKREDSLKQFRPRRLSKLRGLADTSFSMLRNSNVLEDDQISKQIDGDAPMNGNNESMPKEGKENVELFHNDLDEDEFTNSGHVLFGAIVSPSEMEYLEQRRRQKLRTINYGGERGGGGGVDSKHLSAEIKKKRENERADKELRNLALSMPLLVWGFFIRELFAGVFRIFFLILIIGLTLVLQLCLSELCFQLKHARYYSAFLRSLLSICSQKPESVFFSSGCILGFPCEYHKKGDRMLISNRAMHFNLLGVKNLQPSDRLVLSLWKGYYLFDTTALQHIWCDVFGKSAHKVLAKATIDDEDDGTRQVITASVMEDTEDKIDIGEKNFRGRGSSRSGFSTFHSEEPLARKGSQEYGSPLWLHTRNVGSARRSWEGARIPEIRQANRQMSGVGDSAISHIAIQRSTRSRRRSKALDKKGRVSSRTGKQIDSESWTLSLSKRNIDMDRPWYKEPFMSVYSSTKQGVVELSWSQFLAATALLLMLCIFRKSCAGVLICLALFEEPFGAEAARISIGRTSLISVANTVFTPLAGFALIVFQQARGCGGDGGPPTLLTFAVAVDAACAPIYLLERFAEAWYWKATYTRPLQAVILVYGSEYPFPFFAFFDGTPRRANSAESEESDTKNRDISKGQRMSHSRVPSLGLLSIP